MNSIPPNGGFGLDDVEVLDVETVFAGYFRVDRWRVRFRLFEGGWSSPAVREVFERGHAVAVLLYDPHADALVLIEQFRVGALAASRSPWFGPDQSPWLIELVAGVIDDGETAENVACREAIEEAGCQVDRVERIMTFLSSAGGTSETLTLYLGRVNSAGVAGIHGLEHEHENIRVLVVPSAEVFRWLDAERIPNAHTLIGLQWFRIHRDEVRRRWLGLAAE